MHEQDPTLWVGLAACGGALANVALVPVVGVASIGAVFLWRSCARWIPVLALAAFVAGFVRAHRTIARHEREQSAIVDVGIWPARCDVVGRVARSPVRLGAALRVEVEASEIRCRDGPFPVPETSGSALRGRISVYVPEELPRLGRGDELAILASLAPPYRFFNDGTGDPRPSSARRGVVLSGAAEDVVVLREGSGLLWTIDRVRARVRQRIDATFPADTAAMARALVLGEDDLAEEDQRAFRRSGLAHLLAVSGAHLVLVIMGLVAALRATLARVPPLAARIDVRRLAALVGLPLAWVYAELAGASGSAVRAAWMCSVALLAYGLARRPSAWRSLGLSLLAMAIVDPLVAFDLSFTLSAFATTGILALNGRIEAAIVGWAPRLPAFVVKPFATTTAATVACAPVLATIAPELSISGLLANVIAVPLGEAAALPLCLVHALLSAWPAAESGCAACASGALAIVRRIAHAFTWGTIPVPAPTAAELAALAGVAMALALGRARRGLVAGAVALAALEVGVRIRGAPHGVVRVTFIDVGQGDAALVDLPDGSAILVDGGGLVGSPIDVGERAVAPLLAARRRGSVDAVVLSHPHPDHFLGLSAVLARVRAGAFWDNGQDIEGGGHAAVLADVRARGIPVVGPAELCGARSIGGAIVEVLAPCPALVPDRGANDNSFVLRVRFGERAILLTGDAEHEEEDDLVRRNIDLRADVLKVGHHGSRTSTSPAFLAAVSPKLAVISCGVRNRFGHPHAPTLDALSRAGTRVLRTDRDGSVVVTTDGHSLEVRTMR